MSETTTDRDRILDETIAAYMRALALGSPPARDEWLAAHPELAVDLAEFLADRDRLERWARPLRDAGAAVTVPAAELAGPGVRVRYVGDYELADEIARGGMGVVYRARQLSLARPVALKMILAGAFAQPRTMQRFRAEAEAAAALDHPGIVPIYEIGDYQGQPYFSMKLIDGGDLKQLLPTLRREPRRGIAMLAKVARAVHYAHQHGIIHRDLKPSNILIDKQGEPHLTDFGLARRTADDSDLTHTGDVLGTPNYMAPEQAAGTKTAATTLADVYSLGAILYELLTGVTPFRGENTLETLRKVREENVVALRQVQPTVDRDLEAVCMKCLAKDPAERYATAAELADELDRWLVGDPVSVQPGALGWQVVGWLRRNIRAAVWIILVGMLGGGLGTFLFALSSIQGLMANARRTYQNFPGLHQPTLLAYWPDVPNGMLPICTLVGLILMLSMGPLAIALVRPRRPMDDLQTGLGTGAAAALASFLTGVGWAVAMALTIVPSIPDLALFAEATSVAVAPATHSTDVLADHYPDLKHVAPDHRGNLFMAKIVSDQVSHSFIGVWMATLFSLAIIGGSTTMQTVAAGYLWRRSTRFWSCVLPYVEINLSGMWLLLLLFLELTSGFAEAMTTPGSGGIYSAPLRSWGLSLLQDLFAAVPLFGFALAGTLKRWPFFLRGSLFAVIISFWNAMRLTFDRWSTSLLIASVALLLIYAAYRVGRRYAAVR